MKIIIAGGTGFIGQYLIKKWLQENRSISVIGRSEESIYQHFGKQVKALTWQNFAVKGMVELSDADLMINLSGANIGSQRWTKQRKQEIIESRMHTTKLISSLCSVLGDKSPPWFNASAVGIYGLQKDGTPATPSFDETSAIVDEAPDFLSQVAHEWEAKTNPAKAHGVRVVNLRFAIVLGPQGGVLKKLIWPFKLFMGGIIGTGKQPFPWIHIEDLYQAIEFLYQHPELNGPVNMVAPQAITQQQFATALGKTLNRPSCVPMPAFVLKLLLGEMANELLLHGQKATPNKLIDAGFTFQYPEINQALKNILQ